MLVENKKTEVVWAVNEARAAFLISTGDYVEVVPDKPKRTAATKKTIAKEEKE